MAKSLYPLRGLALLSLLALACGGDSGTNAGPVPSTMAKVGGDDQTGAPGAVLTQPMEVRITDAGGVTIANYAVTFTASAGTVNPASTTTDTQGRARTVLTLPTQPGTVTVTASAEGVASATFTARSVAPPVNITPAFLPAARLSVPYQRAIRASGGATNAAFTYSLASGSLPPGLTLQPDGTIAGTASSAGSFPISVKVSDGQHSEATQNYTLNVCEAATPLAVNEVRTLQPATRGSCGLFLPAGAAGARYRITVARPENAQNGADVAGVSVIVSGNGVSEAPVTAAAPSALLAERPVSVPELDRYMRMLAQNRREHARLLEQGEELARQLPPQALLREGAVLRVPEAAVELPDRIRVDPRTPATCGTTLAPVTGILLAQNDWLAVYQDSAQNSILSTQVSSAEGARLIELATTYGRPVIDRYFGVLGDIDNNGKVIVFITPAMGQSVGKVWSGNFYRKANCGSSNEGEYVFLHYEAAKDILTSENGFHIGQQVLVHELKHVSSLYQRLLRSGNGVVDPGSLVDYHPLWMEEGGAELAAEVAARYAWSQLGGPAMNVRVTDEHLRVGPQECQASPANPVAVCTENFSVLLSLVGAQEHLAHQPNSIVARTPGAPESYVYSSGWLFHRWLGDAYGNAASGPFGDAEFFKRLNDRTTPAGVAGIEAVTGKSWAQLIEEFALAATGHGWGGITVGRGFTSYDFVRAIEMWCFAVDPVDLAESRCGGAAGPPGAFPWPVTTDAQGVRESKSFFDSLTEGGAGPSGIRVHEFLSNGTGEGAEINVEAPANARIFVLRLR